jgi:hypothetical protein
MKNSKWFITIFCYSSDGLPLNLNKTTVYARRETLQITMNEPTLVPRILQFLPATIFSCIFLCVCVGGGSKYLFFLKCIDNLS